MPQRYFIRTLLNLLQRAQAATARWIKPGMEAGTTPALDLTVTVSILPAALPPRPSARAPLAAPAPQQSGAPGQRSPSVARFAPEPALQGTRASLKQGQEKMLLVPGWDLPRRAAPEQNSLPPPCESCRTGSLGQVPSWGRLIQERRDLRVIRQGSEIKEKERHF